jgi:hypothetical protein
MSAIARIPPQTRDVPAPPPDLAPDSFAARLYAMLGPVAEQDPFAAWSLLILCNAIGGEYQLVEDWVRDTPDGPGWSLLLDLDRCPAEALPWLGQFVGVRLFPGSTPAEQRQRIASTAGFKRGTRDALIGAARATLTGAQTVIFRERDGAAQGHPAAPDYAYYLTVTTYDSQTPNPAATLAALLAQKPGGIVLTYQHTTGQTYQQLHTNHASYAAVKAAYPTYAGVRDDQPV